MRPASSSRTRTGRSSPRACRTPRITAAIGGSTAVVEPTREVRRGLDHGLQDASAGARGT